MNELPFIDSHSAAIDAAPEVVWDAAARVLPRLGGPLGAAYARLVGCPESELPAVVAGSLPETIVGFRVARAQRPWLIELHGEHRFSRYSLTFRVEAGQGSGSVLIADTHAEFPGRAGRLYRAVVIGSRGHVVVVRRLLSTIQRSAERARYRAGQPAGSGRPRSSYTEIG